MANKFYWLKLQKDFFKRHDIRIIESMENGEKYVLFYLKLICESISHDGELRFSEFVPYNETMLASVTDTDIDVVRSSMKLLTELGMVQILDDATIFMTECEKMIGKDNTAERVKKHREKKKVEEIEDVTKCNVTVTLPSISNSISISNSYKEVIKDLPPDLIEPFEAYLEVRKANKWKSTDYAIKLLLTKLNELSHGDTRLALRVINQSIEKSYRSFFPVSEEKKGGSFAGILSDLYEDE